MNFQFRTTKARFTVRALLLLMSLAAVGMAVWKETQPVITDEAVRSSLRQKFPTKRIQLEGELQYEPGTKVIELELPVLRKVAPHLHVYKTTCSTGYAMCYPVVDVAIVAWAEEGRLETAEHRSPTFSKSSPELMQQFRGLSAPDALERQALAEEIAQILVAITYQGSLKDVGFDGRTYHASIMHGDKLCEIVTIDFDNQGSIQRVALGQ